MKYFTIDTPAESQETGKAYPQVKFSNLKEVSKFKYNSYPDDSPELSASLEKGAKLSDILSQSTIEGHGLLINEKVKGIFNEFDLMSHRIYRCPVEDLNGTLHPYFWLSMSDLSILDSVDFNLSLFFQKKGLKNIGNIVIHNYDHYLSTKQQIDSSTIIKAEKIVFKRKDYDFFKLPLFDNNIYGSERLIKALSNVSGIVVREAHI